MRWISWGGVFMVVVIVGSDAFCMGGKEGYRVLCFNS